MSDLKRNGIDELTNLIMENYDVYDTPSITNRDIRETVELMMSNWKGVNERYKEWRVDMTLRTIKRELNK